MSLEISPDVAESNLIDAGFKPLVKYPGRTVSPWHVECLKCGTRRWVTLARVRMRDARCHHTRSADYAVRELREFHYEPVDQYPGNRTKSWRIRCVVCHEPRLISLTRLNDPKRDTRCRCIRKKDAARVAVEEAREAGYEPAAPYPGKVAAPWPSVCVTCGRRRITSLNSIRVGQRCHHQKPDTSGELPLTG